MELLPSSLLSPPTGSSVMAVKMIGSLAVAALASSSARFDDEAVAGGEI